MIFDVTPTETRVVCSPKELKLLDRWLRIEPGFEERELKNYVHSVRMFDSREGLFPTGLLEFVCRKCREEGVNYEIRWNNCRLLPSNPAVLEGIQPNGLEYRDYQREIIRECLKRGRGIVRAATGAGKTAIMAGLIRAYNYPRTLIVVPSVNLVHQTVEELNSWWGEEIAEPYDKRRLPARVCVATDRSVLSGLIAARLRRPRRATNVQKAYGVDIEVRRYFQEIQLLLMDECHHCSLSTPSRPSVYYSIAMCLPTFSRFGFSATPLKHGFNVQNWMVVAAFGPEMPIAADASSLIQRGYIARPYFYFFQYKKPKKLYSAADWRVVYREIVVCGEERNAAIVEAIETACKYDLKTLLLVEQIEHVKQLHARLQAIDLPVEVRVITGRLESEEQNAVVSWFREPGGKVLLSTRVLGEGTNIPDLDVVVFARAGKAHVTFFQSIGRGVRRLGRFKRNCLIIDFADKWNRYLKRHYEMRRKHAMKEKEFRSFADNVSLDEAIQYLLEEARKEEKDNDDGVLDNGS